jgi:hypothetical protein
MDTRGAIDLDEEFLGRKYHDKSLIRPALIAARRNMGMMATATLLNGGLQGTALTSHVAHGKTFSSASAGFNQTGSLFWAASPVNGAVYNGSLYNNTLSVPYNGCPIFLAGAIGNSLTATTITDTFSSSYTWTLIDSVAIGAGSQNNYIWIGQGGSGLSGTVAINFSGSTDCMGFAVPIIGCSQASGTGAVDVHGHNSGSSSTASGPSLTPSVAGEVGLWFAAALMNTDAFTNGNYKSGAMAMYGPSVAGILETACALPTSAQNPSWGLNGSNYWGTMGAIFKGA